MEQGDGGRNMVEKRDMRDIGCDPTRFIYEGLSRNY